MSQNSFSRNSCRPTNNRNQCEKWDAANIQKSAGHSFLTHRNVLLWLQTQTDYKLIKQLWQNVFSWATGPAYCVRQRWSALPSLAPILRVTISKFLSTINHSYWINVIGDLQTVSLLIVLKRIPANIYSHKQTLASMIQTMTNPFLSQYSILNDDKLEIPCRNQLKTKRQVGLLLK